jgi:hypothetical protein
LQKISPDPELAEKISALVDRGHLDRGDPAYGVALAAIDLGYDRMTRAQRNLYDRVIKPALKALASGKPPEAPIASHSPAPKTPKAARRVAPNNFAGSGWKPIREAPEERDVQLAMMVDGEPSPLAFACRRENRMWINSATGKPVFFRPSHWREWTG